MSNSQIVKYVAKLKDPDPSRRSFAAQQLGHIGDAGVVPPLIEALQDDDVYVRSSAIRALERIGDTSAIPALTQMLDDENDPVCVLAAQALGTLGDMLAVPILARIATGDSTETFLDFRSRRVLNARMALTRLGDATTLPRKILAETRFSPQQRLELLERLRPLYQQKSYFWVWNAFPDPHALCKAVLSEEDAAAKAGAKVVLHYMTLVRASQREQSASAELLRASETNGSETETATLLRGASQPEANPASRPQRLPLWQRLFGTKS